MIVEFANVGNTYTAEECPCIATTDKERTLSFVGWHGLEPFNHFLPPSIAIISTSTPLKR
ncbi:hypothetical protein [Alteromonas facilis]|uniref:hypothetical protein n=1 Tax=Alteromonas facilis TaxID=2048004 RepID=UPI001F0B85B9|nr:hypothetical protein [Alteromonas facilis]